MRRNLVYTLVAGLLIFFTTYAVPLKQQSFGDMPYPCPGCPHPPPCDCGCFAKTNLKCICKASFCARKRSYE